VDLLRSAGTVERRYRTLKSVFQYVVLNRWLAVTPCVGTTLAKVDGTRCVVLTDDQVRAIAAATRERCRPMVWLGALTGVRESEAAAVDSEPNATLSALRV
jgi:integrase